MTLLTENHVSEESCHRETTESKSIVSLKRRTRLVHVPIDQKDHHPPGVRQQVVVHRQFALVGKLVVCNVSLVRKVALVVCDVALVVCDVALVVCNVAVV